MKNITIAKGVYVRSLSEGKMVKKKLLLPPGESRFCINCISLQDRDFTILITKEAHHKLLDNVFKNKLKKFDLILKEVK